MGWDDGNFENEPGQFDDFEMGGGVADGMDLEKTDQAVEMGPPVGKRELIIKLQSSFR